MLKNWMNKRRQSIQSWIDRPLQEKRAERRRQLIELERPRPWQGQPAITGPASHLNRPDPYQQLRPEDRRFAIAKIQGEPRRVSTETLAMLRAMDQVFMEGAGQALDWMQVRIERRQARNVNVAVNQGRQMFDERAQDINQMTEEEAIEFAAAQARAILARARHASDPHSADTTIHAAIAA